MKHKILSVIMALILTFLLLCNMLPTIIWANDSEWTPVYGITKSDIEDVWGNSVFDVFAVVGSGILHYDGSNWSTMANLASVQLMSVWGNSASDVFVVGREGTILHYDGNNWTAMNIATTDTIHDIWAASPTFVFAVGHSPSHSYIYRYDGFGWVTAYYSSTVNYQFSSIWGTSSSDVFVASYYLSTIFHYDGNNWTTMDSGTTEHLEDIWGTSSSDVFAVGSSGTIVHYDGTSWSPMDSGTTNSLYDIWGGSSSDVFAVGTWGTILHYDGNNWSTMNSGIVQDLNGVWGSSASTVFAVGNNGALLQYTPVFNLRVNSTAGGTVTTPDEGTSSRIAGEVVNMVAEVAEGYNFVNWTGDVSTIADVNSSTTTITMNGNYSIIANFALMVIPGDANGDGKVNALDITKVERIIARLN